MVYNTVVCLSVCLYDARVLPYVQTDQDDFWSEVNTHFMLLRVRWGSQSPVERETVPGGGVSDLDNIRLSLYTPRSVTSAGMGVLEDKKSWPWPWPPRGLTLALTSKTTGLCLDALDSTNVTRR